MHMYTCHVHVHVHVHVTYYMHMHMLHMCMCMCMCMCMLHAHAHVAHVHVHVHVTCTCTCCTCAHVQVHVHVTCRLLACQSDSGQKTTCDMCAHAQRNQGWRACYLAGLPCLARIAARSLRLGCFWARIRARAVVVPCCIIITLSVFSSQTMIIQIMSRS
jgi:hypothetical protein